jgi:ABC-2 type transport system permease protein
MKEQLLNILAVAWKELLITLKDRGLLAVLFLLPLIFGIVFSSINQATYSSDEGEEAEQIFDIYVVNLDGGYYGQQVMSVLEQIPVLNWTVLNSAEEADQRIADGERMAAIVIPADFSNQIDAYQPTTVTVIVDPVQMQFAQMVTGLVNYAVSPSIVQGEISYGIRSVFEESGVLEGASAEQQAAVQAQTLGAIMTQLQALEANPLIEVVVEGGSEEGVGEEQVNFFALMVPGFTVMFAFFLVGHIGETLHKERDVGTFRRLLASPMSRWAIIGGPIVAYSVVVVLQVLLLFGVGSGFFGMPLGNNPLALLLNTIVLGMVVSAMGLMISALTKTGQQADTLGYLLGFILAGLGGAFFLGSLTPLYEMGGVIGFLSNLTPQAHALQAYRLIMVTDGTMPEILVQIGLLLAIGLIFFGVAVWRFKFD